MLIKHIKTTKCPFCDSPPYEEGINKSYNKQQLQIHFNGEQFEYRKFLCGLKVEWSPNFSQEVFPKLYPCSNTQEEKEKQTRRMLLKQKLNDVVASSDVDKEFIE